MPESRPPSRARYDGMSRSALRGGENGTVLCDRECPDSGCPSKRVCGGAMFGSGTHGLQSRTLSPPPRLSTTVELLARAASTDGREVVVVESVGGCTMY